jgi:hypothetical protein
MCGTSGSESWGLAGAASLRLQQVTARTPASVFYKIKKNSMEFTWFERHQLGYIPLAYKDSKFTVRNVYMFPSRLVSILNILLVLIFRGVKLGIHTEGGT